MDREAKLDALWDRMARMMNILGEKMLEMYEANLNANIDYLEEPMLLPKQEKTQGLDNEQDMFDAQESIEEEEEGDLELIDCLPISCAMLTREYHDLMAKADRERCFEETRDHIEDAESDVEEETTHGPLILTECHHDHEESFETERDQETSENTQGFPTSTTEDILEEAQEDIRPPNQLIQETESCCTSAQRNTRISSPLTEEEID